MMSGCREEDLMVDRGGEHCFDVGGLPAACAFDAIGRHRTVVPTRVSTSTSSHARVKNQNEPIFPIYEAAKLQPPAVAGSDACTKGSTTGPTDN